MSILLDGDLFSIPYKRGDKLIVFKKTGTTELKRKFRRILEYGRLDNLSFKRIQKFPIKEVYCCTLDTVEFVDGSIEWTSSVAKPGELKQKLTFFKKKFSKKNSIKNKKSKLYIKETFFKKIGKKVLKVLKVY